MGMAIHCLPDSNNNAVIEDSVYLYFFELPSDLERIRLNHSAVKVFDKLQ
uniref:Uncharacterized protein n=1 Tax=Candidatus Methanogaster sp. ANME-2c ERB4 TaxID=2759911 RepID=A0A7G9YLC3_9EURY|nr:hypothetical protein IMBEDNDK_00017 [Methanosarcinales archaeon ANME-2c ERB4]